MSDRVPSKIARYVRRFLRNMGGEDIRGAGGIDSDSVNTESATVTNEVDADSVNTESATVTNEVDAGSLNTESATVTNEVDAGSVNTGETTIERYAGQVSQNADDQTIPSGELTELENLNATETDQLDEFDGNARIVCSRDATYHVRAIVKFAGSSDWSTGDSVILVFAVNGSTTSKSSHEFRKVGTSGQTFVAETVFDENNIDLSEGDEISVFVEQDSGGSNTTRRFRRTRLEWWSA